MAFNNTLNQLERLAYLIQRKATGTPVQLAERMDVSIRTVTNLINLLRDRGADINYCKVRRTYYFERPVKLCFDIVLPIKETEYSVMT